MSSYLHPGVYVEEIPSGSKPIEGVATSVAAFVGRATKGPVGEAELVQSFDDYNDVYGDIASESDAMGLAVRSFYLNGGKSAFICRLAGSGSLAASAEVDGEGTGGTQTADPVLIISASSEGVWGNSVYFKVVKPDQDSLTFDLKIGHQKKGEFVEDEAFDGLSMRAEDDNYALAQVNGNSAYVTLSLGDAGDPENASEQYQGATLTGGEVDSTVATYFSAGISVPMSLTLNINGLGAEQITLDPTALSLAGDHDADGVVVGNAIRDAVRALSLDAPHQAFNCQYDTASHRFELTSVEDGSSASLAVYDGTLAALLRIDSAQPAVLTSDTIPGGATRFSSAASGLPSLTQPMKLSLNVSPQPTRMSLPGAGSNGFASASSSSSGIGGMPGRGRAGGQAGRGLSLNASGNCPETMTIKGNCRSPSGASFKARLSASDEALAETDQARPVVDMRTCDASPSSANFS